KADSCRRCTCRQRDDRQTNDGANPNGKRPDTRWYFTRDVSRKVPDDLAGKKNDHSAKCRENAAADQKPAQDADMHIHVMRYLLRRHWSGSYVRRGRLLSALAAEPRMRRDFIATL